MQFQPVGSLGIVLWSTEYWLTFIMNLVWKRRCWYSATALHTEAAHRAM